MHEWLTARPIAHRGLHDAAKGVIENTPSAFEAAIEAGYGIECDVQLSADGEAMVHHDDVLGRLTEGAGRLDAMTAAALKRVAFRGTADRMLTLGELLELVSGRTALFVEIKSHFDRERGLVERVGTLFKGCSGPLAAMSFDPGPIAALRDFAPEHARGLVAMARTGDDPKRSVSVFRYVGQALAARPDFLAYRVQDLATAIPQFARRVLRLPLLAWTVRSPADRAEAKRLADQMIFEGFRP